jgi:hypothetical protein
MMTLVNTLQSQGITLSMIQLAILGVIAVYIIGTYWKILITGAAVVTVAIVLLHSENTTPLPSVNATPASLPTPVTESVKPPAVNYNKAPKDFIDDCTKGAEYSKTECQKLWQGPSVINKSEVEPINSET